MYNSSGILRFLLGSSVLLAMAPSPASAQVGSNDLTFNSLDQGFGYGDGANGQIAAMITDPIFGTIIAGDLDSYNGTPCGRIAKINTSDGQLDPDFAPGTGADGPIEAVAFQPDGKIIVAGVFNTFNTVPCSGLVRLNSDGSVDGGFNNFGGTNLIINAVGVRSDGRIVIAGSFTQVNGTARNGIAVLNSSGSLASTSVFNPGTGAVGGRIHALRVLPDDKVIIAGEFTTYNGTTRKRVARLNATGTLDTGFTPPALNNTVHAFDMQSNGKVVIGGDFTGGTTPNRIARLNANGTVDAGFDPGSGGANSSVRAIAVIDGGYILIGGAFSVIAGIPRNRIAVLNLDGTLDSTFFPHGLDVSSETIINSIVLLVSSENPFEIACLIGGGFFSYGDRPCGNIMKVHGLDPDLDFNFGMSANDVIYCQLVLPNDMVMIGGQFSAYQNQIRRWLARLLPDGSLDASFNGAPNQAVHAMAVQPDGNVLIAGAFTSYNGVNKGRIARVLANGALDAGFGSGTGANNFIRSVVLQPDGKVLIGGTFTTYDGVARNRVARLNTDGSLDLDFDPGTGAPSNLESIALQPDGKVLIGGYFTSYNGTPRAYLARLLPNGLLDPTFDAAVNDPVLTIALQADGAMLIGGYFSMVEGSSRNRIARLTPDGELDADFDPGTGANATVGSITVEPDGHAIIAGTFTTYDGNARNGIARLHADGGLDTSFGSGSGPNSSFSLSCALQSTGNVLIAGNFTAYEGIGRNRITRLYGENADSDGDGLMDYEDGCPFVFGTIGDPCDDLNATTFNDTLGNGCICSGAPGGAALSLRVHLEGPYSPSDGLMTDALRTLPDFPTIEPYTALGYAHVGGGGEHKFPSNIYGNGNGAIVDWVVVELRSQSDPSIVVASRSAFVNRTGNVVTMGNNTVLGLDQPAGSYYVAIRHRNHLPCMTAGPIDLLASPPLIDFTLASTPTYGTDARKSIPGPFPTLALWAGDVNFSDQVKYTGSGNDRDPILSRIGGSVPTNVGGGYFEEDVNMDGSVKYTGSGNDRDPILTIIGGTVPTNVRNAQLP